MASSADLKIAMVAGEVSGDMLAARLMAGLRPALPGAQFHGIGGPRMAEQGFHSHVSMDRLTIRGLFEVIPKYRELKAIQNQLRDQLLAERPAVFIGADYPGFNLGLEERLRAAGIPTVHFVSPQIWAWRGGRIKKIARAVSHMLLIFPFEEEIYRKAGIPATYIGHPLAEVIPMTPDQSGARARLGIGGDVRVVTVMPGSRMGELKYLTEPFIGAIKLLAARDPDLHFVMPMAGERQHAHVELALRAAGMAERVQLVSGDSHGAIAAADAVLAASGTATLEVALFKKPMVIAYKVFRPSYELMRHMAYQPWIGLPNVLAREFLVPEFIQHDCTPPKLAEALWQQLSDAAGRGKLVQRFTDMHHSLLRDSAKASAQAVLGVIGRKVN